MGSKALQAQWKVEKTRIQKLQWWDQVKALAGFPADPTVWHLHPVGVVGNFYAIAVFQFTLPMLQHIFPGASTSDLQEAANELNAHIKLFKLDTALRREHFFAQVLDEVSVNFSIQHESLNYSSSALMAFSYFAHHPEEAQIYGRNGHPANQEAIGNRAYAGKNGNGNIESGDGWKFRGRGIIQLTGRGWYKQFTEWHKENASEWPQDADLDFEANPDLVGQLKYAVRSACFYWSAASLAHGAHLYTRADNGSTQDVVDSVTRGVNPGLFSNGTNGRRHIENRRTNFSNLHSWKGLE
jgi:predicted chitinase